MKGSKLSQILRADKTGFHRLGHIYLLFLGCREFLPVGHTLEDVDQFFSRVATQLRKTGAECVEGR